MMKRGAGLAILCAVLLTVAAPAKGTPHPVADVEVHDGDTVSVTVDGLRRTVRYLLMDSPELHHPERPEEELGLEARAFNRDLLSLGPIRLEFDTELYDRYNRLLAYLWVETPGGELLVNEEMVRAGLALPLIIPPNRRYHERIFSALREAKAAGAGLWARGREKVFSAAQLWSEAPYLAGAFVTVRLRVERAQSRGERLVLSEGRVSLTAYRNKETEPLWSIEEGQTILALGKVLATRGRCEIRLTSAEQILGFLD